MGCEVFSSGRLRYGNVLCLSAEMVSSPEVGPGQKRSLIAERVRAGLRNARAKGKRLGRPRVAVDRAKVAALRRGGASWRAIAKRLKVAPGTVRGAVKSVPMPSR